MMRNLYAVLVLAGFFCSVAAAEIRETVRPNMIVILADDLGYGDLGCTGSKQIPTPSIDRLAKEGVFCSRAYVTAPMCAPSRMGLLTGRFPKRYGITTNPNSKVDYLPDSHYGLPLTEKLIPEYLEPFGYRSAVFGKWHLGHTKGFTPPERGFTHWWGFLGGSRDYFPRKKEIEGLNPSAIESNFTDKTGITYLTDDITDRAVEFLNEAKQDKKPFFMFVSYNAPHWPMQAKPEDIALFKNIQNRERRLYCAMVYAMDKGIGRILDTLKKDGLDGNTMVVFLSDNGGAPEAPSCNAPFRGHKRLHFEGGVRVPFIIKYPADKRLVPGSVCKQPVSTVDLLPALLKANGAEIPKNLDGMDILSLVGNRTGEVPRTMFWCTDYTSAVMDGDLKYLLVPDRAPQCYRVSNDYQEQKDLYFQNPALAVPLAQKLGSYLTETPACRYPDSIQWSSKLLKEYSRAARPEVQPGK